MARLTRTLARRTVESPTPPPLRPAGPFLKWAGGKSQLVRTILERLPPTIDTYFEPFVGGGAVFFALAAAGRFERAIIGDRNRALVEIYSAVQRDVETVILHLRLLRSKNNQTDYYAIRAIDPATLTLAERAARLIYLNKTCYNGLYRVNRRGIFNVPFGDNPRKEVCDEEGLRGAWYALKKTTIFEGDFEHTVRGARPGDAVYFDPPYYPISATSHFTEYDRDPFDHAEHARLAQMMGELATRKVFALLSNSDCAATRKLYGGFGPDVVLARRMINSVGTKRGKITELLVHNGIR